ncbi:MAG: hypothetical protein FWF51_08960 [Chitinivibrionia bacterium]|nr:hypothetical protein [Chitinivibrionia bacterium]
MCSLKQDDATSKADYFIIAPVAIGILIAGVVFGVFLIIAGDAATKGVVNYYEKNYLQKTKE